MSVWWRYFAGVVILIAVAFAFVYWNESSLPAGRQTMEEVVAIAQDFGLHCRSDRYDGVVGARLLVSESPLSLERITLLTFCRAPEHPDWNGTVAVYRTKHSGSHINYPYTDSVPWGSFLLYGDPALIKRLTSQGNEPGRGAAREARMDRFGDPLPLGAVELLPKYGEDKVEPGPTADLNRPN
jgi:hypothetical protein